jgi:hypothetical protein
VSDEVLAGLAALVGVMDAGVDERLLDSVSIDRERRLIGVLLDDREQVTEQLLLERREVGTFDERMRGRIAEAVDALARARKRRRRRSLSRLAAVLGRRLGRAGGRLAATDRPAQPSGGGFVLLRYRLPSSYRCANALYDCELSSAVGATPAIARAGRSRSRLTSSNSARTRISRAASRADRPCGPSPRSKRSSSSPATRCRSLRAR